jgi:hypothetical protein
MSFRNPYDPGNGHDSFSLECDSWTMGKTGAELADFVKNMIMGLFMQVLDGHLTVYIDEFVNVYMSGLYPDLKIYGVREANKMLNNFGYKCINSKFGPRGWEETFEKEENASS